MMTREASHLVGCESHGCRTAWIVCRHVAEQGRAVAVARRLGAGFIVGGEVLCATCARVEWARRESFDELQFVCGICTVDRFRLTEAN